MKRFPKKIIFILASVCLGLGIIICTAGFAMAGFNLDRLSGRQETRFSESYDLPEGLLLHLSDLDVQLTSGAGTQVQVEGENCRLDVTRRADGTLAIQQARTNRAWYEMMELSGWERGQVTVTLPESFSGAIQVEMDGGNLTAENLPKLQAMRVEKGDGKTTLTGLQTEAACSVEQAYGSVILEQVSAGSVTLDLDDGALSLTEVDVAGQLTVQKDMGAIQINQVAAAACKIEAEDGQIQLQDSRIEGELQAYLDMGNIHFNRSTAGVISCEVEDGSVTGTLLGSRADYKVGVEIEDGSSNLQTSHTGEKEIRIKIDMGRVDLDFAE